MLFDDKSRVYLKIVCKSQMTERGLWLLTKSVQFPHHQLLVTSTEQRVNKLCSMRWCQDLPAMSCIPDQSKLYSPADTEIWWENEILSEILRDVNIHSSEKSNTKSSNNS